MVEVVGTAPTSAMVITKFVYRCSWKTNKVIIIIKINLTTTIIYNFSLNFKAEIVFSNPVSKSIFGSHPSIFLT